MLNRGRVKEFGEPYALLQNSESLLQRMIRQTGSNASKKLNTMAYRHHYKHQEPLKQENNEDCASNKDDNFVLLAEHIIEYT